MAAFKIVLLGLMFLLLPDGAMAANCPERPVTPEQFAVLDRAKKEMEKGRDRQALKILSDYSFKDSESSHPQFPFLRGLIAYRLKNYETAEAMFKKAIQWDPCFGEAWQNLAVVYHQQKRPDRAARAMKKAYSLITPENPDLMYQSALFELKADQPENAIALLKKLAQEPRPRRSWLILLADTLIQEERSLEAANVLQRAAKAFNAPELQYRAALLYVHGGKAGMALPLLEELGNRKKAKAEWLLALSQVYARFGKSAKAALTLERANRLKSDPEHRYRAARLWIEAGRPEKALPLLRPLCAKANAPQKYRATLVHVLQKLGKTKEAEEILAQGSDQPKSPADSFRSALMHLKEGAPEKALPLLRTLAESNAPDPQWLAVLAITLERLDKPGQARSVMERVDTKSPSLSSKLRLQMAIFWLCHDRPDRALSLLEVLIKDKSADKGSRVAYIEALVRTGKAEKANAFLAQLLKQYPDDQNIWHLLAWAALEQEDYRKAAAALEVAFRFKPPDAREWKRLGNLYRLAGVPAKAASAYEKAFGESPTAEEYDLLAAAYGEAHQIEKAILAARRAAKADPSAKRFSRLGRLYVAEDDLAKGLRAFQKAAKMSDEGGTNSLRVGYAALELDQLDVAETAFESVLTKADPGTQTASRAAKALKVIQQLKNRKPSASSAPR